MPSASVRLLVLLVTLASGCLSRWPHAGPASIGAGACPAPTGTPLRLDERPAGRLCGRLRIAAGAAAPDREGNLVVSWYRPEEKAQFNGGRLPPMPLISALLDRARVTSGVRLGGSAGVEYSIDYPGGEAVVLAIADHRQMFWDTLLGGEGAGNFIGLSPAAVPLAGTARRADVVLEAAAPESPPPERCQGDRFRLVRVEAPELAGTIGNETSRRLCVWLPASYRRAPRRRYPVVYLLPGFAGRDISYLASRQELRTTADTLARDGVAEAILVGVDTSTRHGSTYFTDSAPGGAWASFARQRLTAEIDRRYRTRAEPGGRALVGHSTGGFNAVSLAVRFPELFGVVAASAPDALDLEGWLLEADGRVRPRWLAWARLEAAVGGMGQIISYAAAWSNAAFPFDLETGALRPDSWPSWKAQSPLRLLDDPGRAGRLHTQLGGRLLITVGQQDEFGLHDPAQRFSARLTELGVTHTFRSSPGGHSSDQRSALISALTFAMRTMAEGAKRRTNVAGGR